MVRRWDKVVCMLIGEYRHTIDEKRRISIPSNFRQKLGKKIVITRGLDNCLFVYPLKEWQSISDKLALLGMGQADTRGINRFILASAIETSIDSIGRIIIPDHLISFAKIKSKVVFAGVHNRIEIWDEKTWDTYTTKIMSQADDIAQKLGDIGAL